MKTLIWHLRISNSNFPVALPGGLICSPGRCSPVTAVYIFPLRLKRRCETWARRALAWWCPPPHAPDPSEACLPSAGGSRPAWEEPPSSFFHLSTNLLFAQLSRPVSAVCSGFMPVSAAVSLRVWRCRAASRGILRRQTRRRNVSSAAAPGSVWENNYSWPKLFSCNGGKSNVFVRLGGWRATVCVSSQTPHGLQTIATSQWCVGILCFWTLQRHEEDVCAE